MAVDRKAQLASLAQRLKGPRGFYVALSLLLMIRILFALKELGGSSYAIADPNPFSPKMELTPESDTYLNVKDMLNPWKPFAESDYKALGDLNMFDWKDIANRERLEQQANDAYAQAAQLVRAGDPQSLTQAETLVNEALKISPNDQKSRQLLEQIKQLRGAMGEPAAGTGATTATATR